MTTCGDPARAGQQVSPSDTDVIFGGPWLYVWTDGDLAFVTENGDRLPPSGVYPVVAGQVIPYRVAKVLAATTATVTTGLS